MLGATVAFNARRLAFFFVSILTQLLCWVQPLQKNITLLLIMFQSSPSFYAGCNNSIRYGGRPEKSFNPHPAFMLGATYAEI